MPARAIPYVKAVVHLLLLLPVVYLLKSYHDQSLAAQADPVNYLTHFTGNWALWILLGDLAITPLRRLLPALGWLVRLRRMIGLYAFFYATLHLLIYMLLFSGYDAATALAGLKAGHLAEPWTQWKLVWPSVLDDLKKRRFIQVGLLAWLILLALAVSSPQRVLRSMGGKRWQALHRMIYLAAAAGVVHYWWLVKRGVRSWWPDAFVLLLLLSARLAYTASQRRKRPPVVTTAQAAF